MSKILSVFQWREKVEIITSGPESVFPCWRFVALWVGAWGVEPRGRCRVAPPLCRPLADADVHVVTVAVLKPTDVAVVDVHWCLLWVGELPLQTNRWRQRKTISCNQQSAWINNVCSVQLQLTIINNQPETICKNHLSHLKSTATSNQPKTTNTNQQ